MRSKKTSRWSFAIGSFILVLLFSSVPTSANGTADYSTTNSPYVEGTDEAASVFDPLDVSDIQLDVSPAIIDYFRYCCNWEYEGPWKEAQLTMTVKGQTIGPLDVGFHLKGAWGSWRGIDSKPGIKIKVDAFVEGQTIFGVKKLILNNMAQDGPALNQPVTMRLFRAMNVPASRTGYAHLQINDQNYGLYTLMESLDRISLARWFDSTQHLYKGGVPYHWADLYPDYEWVFQVETGSLTNRSDLMPLLNANVSANWWTEIQKVADMQEMVREWAVELAVGHWDGYAYNGNNYFIHSNDDGIFTMMPWGVDNTWGSSIDYRYTNKSMSQNCIQTPECYALYLQAVADATYAIKTLDLEGMVDDIAGRINQELQNNVEPYWRRDWFFTWDLDSTIGYQNWTKSVIDGNYDWAMNAYWDSGFPEIKRFDSALASLEIEGQEIDIPIAENNLPLIYLEDGVTQPSITAQTRQLQADYEIVGATNLVPGLNTIMINTISLNGLSTQTYELNVYLKQKFTKTIVAKVTPLKKKLLPPSITKLQNFAVIAGADAIGDISVSVVGALKNGKARLASIVKTMTAVGMPTPAIATYKTNAKTPKNTFKVTISYLK